MDIDPIRSPRAAAAHHGPGRDDTAPTARDDDSWPRTHAYDGRLVVFHIGMTVRKPHRPDLWVPAFLAMPRMITELSRNLAASERGEAEHLGFLGADYLMGARGPWVVQYWTDVDKLYTYARAQDKEHAPAWRAFNATARKHPQAVGIWHETYVVEAGGVETLYGNGAMVGLGAKTGSLPVRRRGSSARQRLGASRSRTAAAGSHPEGSPEGTSAPTPTEV
ncbi:DUF4188 domain-containing protein [Brachybacterium sp. AOP25-B2-12]|uniref:DUF4188 domain-containing protein n=1 Tax=Brachybacterium sp. AOP25-B2-12 TaxID=3457710 RepID=UPI00403427F1